MRGRREDALTDWRRKRAGLSVPTHTDTQSISISVHCVSPPAGVTNDFSLSSHPILLIRILSYDSRPTLELTLLALGTRGIVTGTRFPYDGNALLSAEQNTKNQTAIKLTVVPCPPVVEVKIKRPDTKYQLGFSVQNGVVSGLMPHPVILSSSPPSLSFLSSPSSSFSPPSSFPTTRL